VEVYIVEAKSTIIEPAFPTIAGGLALDANRHVRPAPLAVDEKEAFKQLAYGVVGVKLVDLRGQDLPRDTYQ
jgi:hypothetical protein